jgi:AsmA protein
MRILLRALAVVVLLLVAAVVTAALILPGVVDSDEFRERVGAAAGGGLGREVRYGAIDFGLFPPSVVVAEVVISGGTAESAPLLEGGRLELRASLLPLLARTLVVDSVSLRGGRFNLVRNDAGISIPALKSTSEAALAADPDEADAGFDLAVAAATLEKVDIVLEDRSVSPSVTWELCGINASARGVSADEPIELEFEFELASAGKISGSGYATLTGAVDLDVKISEFALESLRAYIDSDSALSGRLSGTIAAVGPAANLESLRVDAQLSNGRFVLDDMEIVGSVKLVADLHGSLTAPRGTFDIDATDAAVRYGGMFTKPPGDAATLHGKLVESSDGSTGIDDIHFKMRNFKGTASVQGRGAREPS